MECHYFISVFREVVELKIGDLHGTGFEIAIRNAQFLKCFDSLRMSFCIFSKNCELQKSDTS